MSVRLASHGGRWRLGMRCGGLRGRVEDVVDRV